MSKKKSGFVVSGLGVWSDEQDKINAHIYESQKIARKSRTSQ